MHRFESRPLILCPLRYERWALERAGLGRHCDLAVCGPGATGIASWAAMHHALKQPIILAGLAGALTPTHRPRSAWVIAEVRDPETGRQWRPTFVPDNVQCSHRTCSITSTVSTLTHHSAKLAAHERSGADLVDLESVAFAQHADRAGWTWAIVRGVSDALDMSLPTNIDAWVDRRGQVRAGVVLTSLMRQPTLVPVCMQLRRNSEAAMRAVAQHIEKLIAAQCLG